MGGTGAMIIQLLGENLADWLGNNSWAIWFSLAVLLAIAEILSLDLVFIMLAAGAVAGGVTALVAPGLWWLQILVAVVVSVITLLLLRPTLMRRVRNMPGYRSAFSSMVGRPGRATAQITSTTGEVKIDGQIWTARAFTDDMVIDPGTGVEVYEVQGAMVIVYPRDGEPGDDLDAAIARSERAAPLPSADDQGTAPADSSTADEPPVGDDDQPGGERRHGSD